MVRAAVSFTLVSSYLGSIPYVKAIGRKIQLTIRLHTDRTELAG